MICRGGPLSALLIFFCLSVGHAATGVLEGLVTFPGETPPRAMFANRREHDCPHGIAQTHLLVRQENRGLRNALIILEAEGIREVQSRQATLRAKGCVLEPRVQSVLLGTSLQLLNEDPAEHRIHAYLKVATQFEVSLLEGQRLRRPLVQPGFYRVNCDRHAWERAWVYVSQHPYIAVTDATGRFQIPDIPPGSYQVRAWHEGWQERTKDSQEHIEYIPMEEAQVVKIRAKKTLSIRFDHLAPTLEVH